MISGEAGQDRVAQGKAGSLRRTYLLVLLLLGGLSLTSLVLLSAQGNASRSNTALINLSGHQRMLSQRVAWDATQLASAAPAERAALRADLEKTLGELSRAHARLRDPGSGLYSPRDAAVLSTYQGEGQLDAGMGAFLASAGRIARLADGRLGPDNPDVRSLQVQARGPLLAGLDGAVAQAERRSDGYIAALYRLAWVRVFSVLLILGALGLFVLRPLERRNRRLLSDLTRERNFAQAIIGTMGQGVAVTDADFHFRHVNPALGEMLGYSAAELIGRSPLDLGLPGESAAIPQGGEPRSPFSFDSFNASRSLLRRDGTLMPALVSAVAFEGGAVTVVTDLSAHEQAERAVREREAHYRTLAANFPQGAVVLFDRDLRYLIADGAGLRAVGLSRERMEGRTLSEIFPPEVADAILPGHLAALEGEAWVQDLSLSDRTYRVHIFPVPGENGVQYGTVIVQDVTEQRRAENEVMAQGAELALLAQQADAARRDALTLADLTRVLGGAHTFEDITQSTFDLLAPAVGASWLALVGRPAMQPQVLALHGQGQVSGNLREQLSREDVFSSRAMWRAVEAGPLYLSGGEHPVFGRSVLEEQDVTDAAIVPLPHKPERGPVLLIAARSGYSLSWSPSQRALLEGAARTVCAAWERMALLGELRVAADHARALVEVSRLAESALPPEEVARQAGAIVAQAAGVDWAGLVVAEGDHARTLTAHSSERVSETFTALVRHGLSRGQGLLWQAFDSGQAIYADDYAALQGVSATLVREGARSAAWVPLSGSGDVRFMLSAVRLHEARAWSAQDRDLFEAVARTLSVVLERRAHLQEMEQAALSDRLTGLGNRRAFERDLDALAAEARRHGSGFGVVMIDMDGLKAINDSEGHGRGDALLRAFGEALTLIFRSEDRVYRLGGDEFALLLPHSGQAVETLLGRVQQAAALTRQMGFAAAASAGIAFYPQDGATTLELVGLADERMYEDKQDRKLRQGEPQSGAEGESEERGREALMLGGGS